MKKYFEKVRTFLNFRNTIVPSKINEEIPWKGNVDTWEEAKQLSKGYADPVILKRCKESILKVKQGEAVYERDSVLFDKVQYSWPLLACLGHVATHFNNCLNVVDFGGSFGSSYYQNRSFFKELNLFNWTVVEQKLFVESAAEIGDNHLRFTDSINSPDIVPEKSCLLLSGVLQYLEKPLMFIDELTNYGFPFIIIDRTSFINAPKRLTIQTVPEFIYKASYPCWFFNEEKFLMSFQHKYSLMAEFESFADAPLMADDKKQLYWKGFFLKLK